MFIDRLLLHYFNKISAPRNDVGHTVTEMMIQGLRKILPDWKVENFSGVGIFYISATIRRKSLCCDHSHAVRM